jgi:6-pyruvoyltetrahydropterin/6-carboxytetrahydropterin synthase
LIPGKSSLIDIRKSNEMVSLKIMNKAYNFPEQDCVILPLSSTSAENLALYILKRLINSITNKKGITEIEIGVDEGFGQGAFVSQTIK